MTNVIFNRKEFEKQIKLTKEVEEKISLFGTPLESITKDEIEVEIFPNRPDLISFQGFMRGFKAFLGKNMGLKQYKLKPPQKNYEVIIDKSVKKIRPFTVCAIVKNLKFDDEKIKQVIDVQEKLHSTIGRNRKKVAIGVYPLEKIALPIKYKALPPDKIKFIPLESTREMTGTQILRSHPTGKDYAYLLEDYDKYPVFLDTKNKVLSMPPIINSSETGKVTEQTKEIFIECSGLHKPTLLKTLNILATMFADMGGEVYQMNVKDTKNEKTPNLTPETMKINLNNINKLLGLNLTESQVQKLLPKMGYKYKNKTVSIPAWRTDILHEVDIAEDVAIAYGYNKLTPKIPDVATVGQEAIESKIKRKIAEILIGLELLETSTYHLIKPEEAKKMKLKDLIELKDSKTDYKLLRPCLITPTLRIFNENKDKEYPQKLFEIGTIFARDTTNKTETGVHEQEQLIISSSPSNFTELKQILESFSSSLGIQLSLKEENIFPLAEGRSAEVNFNNQPIGIMGEVAPSTLRDWNINMPISLIHISLDEIISSLSKK